MLENLMHLYLYEFTEYDHADTDDHGRFTDEHLPKYWVEPGRFPFVVRVDGKYAGFVLVRRISPPEETPPTHSIAEFFIMRKYRHQSIGRQVAWQVFDLFPGHWVVEVLRENLIAQRFWRKSIAEYTHGNYRDVVRPGWDGPILVFYKEKSFWP